MQYTCISCFLHADSNPIIKKTFELVKPMEYPPTFDLDHQRLVFGKLFKTFAWKSTLGENCDVYQMKPTTCDNDSLDPRVAIGRDEKITIRSADLQDEDGTYYSWEFTAMDESENICQKIRSLIVVNQSGKLIK